MAFRDERQRARVCQILCERVGIAGAFTAHEGPTILARRILRHDQHLYNRAQVVMVLLAWALWDGSGELGVPVLIYTLDREHMQAVASVLLEIGNGPRSLDEWISEEGYCAEPTGLCPHRPACDGALFCGEHGGRPPAAPLVEERA